MKDALVAGVDIGGSHITVALIDSNTREIIENTTKREAIDANGTADEIIHSWSLVIKECFNAARRRPTKIGIAMPSPFDYQNRVSYIKHQNKYDALYGLDVKAKLSAKLGVKTDDISFANDAACFLQGESFSGAGHGFERVFGLTLGTGLRSARSFGKNAFDANLWCSEFKDGIAEDYLSTSWFEKSYKEISGEEINSVKELAAKARHSPLVKKIFDDFGMNPGNFLGPHAKPGASQLVILGGNIVLAFSHFSKSLKKALERAQ